jgi:hypothetical protein
MKRKIFTILGIFILLVGATGCGNKKASSSSSSNNSSGTTLLKTEDIFTDRDLEQNVDTEDVETYQVKDNENITITKEGINELKRLIMEEPLENPIQFLPMSRIKLACADILDKEEKSAMIKNLKAKAESIIIDTKNIMTFKDLSFYPKMVFDNLICEYKNFISLLEGFENAGSC